MPGAIGGAGWGGGAFDPATGIIYIKATNSPALYKILKPATHSDTIDVEYTVDLPHSTLSLLIGSASDTAAEPSSFWRTLALEGSSSLPSNCLPERLRA